MTYITMKQISKEMAFEEMNASNNFSYILLIMYENQRIL